MLLSSITHSINLKFYSIVCFYSTEHFKSTKCFQRLFVLQKQFHDLFQPSVLRPISLSFKYPHLPKKKISPGHVLPETKQWQSIQLCSIADFIAFSSSLCVVFNLFFFLFQLRLRNEKLPFHYYFASLDRLLEKFRFFFCVCVEEQNLALECKTFCSSIESSCLK